HELLLSADAGLDPAGTRRSMVARIVSNFWSAGDSRNLFSWAHSLGAECRIGGGLAARLECVSHPLFARSALVFVGCAAGESVFLLFDSVDSAVAWPGAMEIFCLQHSRGLQPFLCCASFAGTGGSSFQILEVRRSGGPRAA